MTSLDDKQKEEIITYFQNNIFNKKDIEKIINNWTKEEYVLASLDGIVGFFIEEKYDIGDIKQIIIDCPSIVTKQKQKLINKKEYLLSLGYKEKQIKDLARRNPKVYDYSIQYIENKISGLKSLGYDMHNIIVMTSNYPQILDSNLDWIVEKVNSISKLGFESKKAYKMTGTMPQLLFNDVEEIETRLGELQLLGYKKEECVAMLERYPFLMGLSIHKFEELQQDFPKLGYTQEQFMNISVKFPQIFGFSYESLQDKIDLYDSLELHDVPIDYPSILMQGTSLCRLRMKYFNDIGIEINQDNYRQLFLPERDFFNKFKVSRDDLIEIYGEVEKEKILVKKD